MKSLNGHKSYEIVNFRTGATAFVNGKNAVAAVDEAAKQISIPDISVVHIFLLGSKEKYQIL